ncbi:hypothetical protein [Actinoplanes derwentensis]|uniref:Uncharacterized protein n=1 Tax=Actinoplanes derwentensis TaxID=113562 RepID=A0A1H1Z6B6_9ACTN|nr:hypothetical protein [Actinoplanes derwentensis]GID81450.1 hypothetical protein Ade03nite_03740 [Actinoplanes derwentensis]SDT29089.1 hypothetical protein SAMN04489716_3157 [Actinoplanes derwentensis]
MATNWQLLGFMDSIRAWLQHDPPPGPLLVKVAEFGAVLEHDPFSGDAEQEHSSQFFRTIPGTEHDNHIVAISYELEGRTSSPNGREVRCQRIGCVPHPQQVLFFHEFLNEKTPAHHR